MAPRVRVTRLTVNGCRLSDRAWEHLVAKLGGVLEGQVVFQDAPPIVLPAEPGGHLLQSFSWPSFTESELDSGVVTRRELPGGAWREVLRGEASIGLESLDADGEWTFHPSAGPDEVLVAVLPQDADGSRYFGWCRPLLRAQHAQLRESGALIVIQTLALERRANCFASRRRLEEHTLLHEFGHALGLPADPRRTWKGPHAGAHCTRPECVLYPALDWRSLLSALLRGWPLDFCQDCRAELDPPAAVEPSPPRKE